MNDENMDILLYLLLYSCVAYPPKWLENENLSSVTPVTQNSIDSPLQAVLYKKISTLIEAYFYNLSVKSIFRANFVEFKYPYKAKLKCETGAKFTLYKNYCLPGTKSITFYVKITGGWSFPLIVNLRKAQLELDINGSRATINTISIGLNVRNVLKH